MKKKNPAEVAKDRQARLDMMVRERDVWVRLAPVLMKWEGKKINKRIGDQAQEALKEYRVCYRAPEKFLGRGKLVINEDWSGHGDPYLQMDITLGSKEDVECFHYAICMTVHNKWYDENILNSIEQVRRGIPLIAGLCHQWNKLCDDAESVAALADQLGVPGFSIRE